MINLYKIKWTEPSHGMGDSIERVAFVLADDVAQIAKAYPRLTSLDWVGAIAKDLRGPRA